MEKIAIAGAVGIALGGPADLVQPEADGIPIWPRLDRGPEGQIELLAIGAARDRITDATTENAGIGDVVGSGKSDRSDLGSRVGMNRSGDIRRGWSER